MFSQFSRLMGGAGFAALALATGAFAQEAAPAADATPVEAPAEVLPPPPPPPLFISDAIAAGKVILEVRARYESVDQANLALTADAFTVRTRLGWETGDFHGLKGLVEFEDTRQARHERYNVAIPGAGGASLNGKTIYPIVNDPDVTELNRLQVTWAPSPMFTATVGRQRILLDDQRFVGNVGWRQDEQTFDAARADFAYGKLKATYVYVDHVNRILGEARDWKSDSHLLNATWSPIEAFKLQGFVYALDFKNSAANSTKTTGAKVTGKVWAGLVQMTYNATYAKQSDYGSNPAHFDLDYMSGDLAGAFDIYIAKIGYEQLAGNGTLGFTTPLGTTHAFNGWTDSFATAGGNKTNVDGLKNLYASVVLRPRFRYTYWQNTEITTTYHDFEAERTGAHLGHEWNVQLTAAITPRLTFLAKYADFTRDKVVLRGTTLGPPDRTKVWFSLEYRL
jgi:hypothetical protein